MMIISLLLLLFSLLSTIHNQCVITQNCQNRGQADSCDIPKPLSSAPQQQEKIAGVCPEFVGNGVCCNDDQIGLLEQSFNLIDYMFGNDGGGCDICAVNIKRFWCYYTCSPQQNQMTQVGELIHVIQDNTDYEVRNVTFYISIDQAINIYQSCQKTQKVSLATPMQSPGGLLNFMGSNSVKQGKSLINVKIGPQSDPSIIPMNFTVEPCNTPSIDGLDRIGYKTKNCTCNNCQDMCTLNIDYLNNNTEYNGLNYWLIISLYLSIIFLTLVVNFVRYFIQKNKKKNRNKSDSVVNYVLNNQSEDISIIKTND